jgi:hypothetical protein
LEHSESNAAFYAAYIDLDAACRWYFEASKHIVKKTCVHHKDGGSLVERSEVARVPSHWCVTIGDVRALKCPAPAVDQEGAITPPAGLQLVWTACSHQLGLE